MAPSDTVYAPPLDDCLTGRRPLISWSAVASALVDPNTDRLTTSCIESFLCDEYVADLINHPQLVFEEPSSKTKADYGTKTSAINVTPNGNGSHNIEEIKADALWLSEACKLSEVAALRIAVLEWQTRAQSHLSGPLSAQDVGNLQEAAGISSVQATGVVALAGASQTDDAETQWTTFQSEKGRRRRLLSMYWKERRNFLATVDELLGRLLAEPRERDEALPEVWYRPLLQAVLRAPEATKISKITIAQISRAYLDALPNIIERLDSRDDSTDMSVLTDDMQFERFTSCLGELAHCLTVFFQLVNFKPKFVQQTLLLSWFNFVDIYGFVDALRPTEDVSQDLVEPTKYLVCAISLSLLNLRRAAEFVDSSIDLEADEDSYLTSSDALRAINDTISSAANTGLVTASPVAFAWALILQRMVISHQARTERRDTEQNQRALEGFEREVMRSPEKQPRRGGGNSAIVQLETKSYDVFLAESSTQQDMQKAETLALSATSGGKMLQFIDAMSEAAGIGPAATFRTKLGSQMRLLLLDVLELSFPVLGYQQETVDTVLRLLGGDGTYWDVMQSSKPSSPNLITTALQNQVFLDFYFQQSLLRYPYEFTPFIKFCTRLASDTTNHNKSTFILDLLHKTPSLTLLLPEGFQHYELVQEEENLNKFRLTTDVPLFAPAASWRRRIAEEEPFCIPAGTQGRLLSDGMLLALMDYEHSGLALLGKRLASNMADRSYDVLLGRLQPDEVAAAVSLLATLVRSETIRASIEGGMAVVAEASLSLPRTKDIISVICESMDALLQEDVSNLEAGKIAAITASIELLDAVLPLYPGRVWAYMSRCELLTSDSNAGTLARITGTLDLVDERFDLMMTALRAFSNLICHAMTSTIQRTMPVRSPRGSLTTEATWLGISTKLLQKVILSITQTSSDVLENSLTWKFASEVQRSQLVGVLVPALTRILEYVHGLQPSSALAASFESAAGYIVEAFLTFNSARLRLQPIMLSLLISIELPQTAFWTQEQTITNQRTVSAVRFMTTLLGVTRLSSSATSEIPGSCLRLVPLIGRLAASHSEYRRHLFALLEALAVCVGTAPDPPSLLGSLGPHLSKSFIQLLTKIDQPYDRPESSIAVWRLASAIIRSGQTWMSDCLLTGKTPREAMEKPAGDAKISSRSLLRTATARFASNKIDNDYEALAVLDFISAAQNHWPRAIIWIHEQRKFIEGLQSYVRQRESAATSVRQDPLGTCLGARTSAYIGGIFAMQLFHLRQMGKAHEFAASLAGDLDYFLRDGIAVDGYNASLHTTFAHNLANRYQGLSLDSFKKTLLYPQRLGNDFFYNLELANSVLGFDTAWKGTKDDGFRAEFEASNLNLSLVDAQVSMFHAWECLLLELSAAASAKDAVINKQMVQVVGQCLDADQKWQGPEHIFADLQQSRVDLALILVQRLAATQLSPAVVAQLLTGTWALVLSIENPYSSDKIAYYRKTLRILYVILTNISTLRSGGEDKASKSTLAIAQTTLNIIDRVVAQAFRSIVGLIHDTKSPVVPEDLALITAIMQAALRVPGIDESSSAVLNIMASHDVVHVALSLYSWSDKLGQNGDPVYGELSLLFLVELSTLPLIAEQLAVDGVLGQIAAANMTTHVARPHVSPLAETPGAQRCYGIWSKGILPLILNILTALGPTIALEAAYILNLFPHLLKSSVERLEASGLSRTSTRNAVAHPHPVTLASVSECNSLALIIKILDALKKNSNPDIPEVKWDSGTLLENVEYWLGSRKVLRERLVPLNAREAEWMGMKGQDGEGSNLLEHKVAGLLEGIKLVLSEDLE